MAGAILPRPVSPRPTVVYLHDEGGSLEGSEMRLRQLAELGMAAVGLDYEPREQAQFDGQFSALLVHLGRQSWARTNAVAWFGRGLGAQRLVAFARQHPQDRPRLLVLLTGTGLLDSGKTGEEEVGGKNGPKPGAMMGDGLAGCRVLLVYGQRESSPQEYERLAQELRAQKADVDLCVVEGHDSNLEEDENLVYWLIAEYCARGIAQGSSLWPFSQDSGRPLLVSTLGPGQAGGLADAGQPEYCPVAAWEERSVWYYWLPAATLFSLLLWPWWRRLKAACAPAASPRPRLARGLWVFAWCIAALAFLQLGWRLMLPRRAISERVLSLARTTLPVGQWQEDFDWLCVDRAWLGKPLKALLEHVELGNLQRRQFYGQLPDTMYRQFVLSPRTSEAERGGWDWRRQFWEAFYPRVRNEHNPVVAALTIVRFLRERVEIRPGASVPAGAGGCWRRGVTDEAGFEQAYVAALRSVGIASRLDEQAKAELWTGEEWVAAPRPLIENVRVFRHL